MTLRFNLEDINRQGGKFAEAVNSALLSQKPAPFVPPVEMRQIPANNKYGNKKVFVDGLKFDSKHEYKYYLLLKAREAKGEIDNLTLQPVFPVVINDKKICKVILDFSYRDKGTGRSHFIDCKGFATEVSKLKKKLVEAQYLIEVEWL